MATTSIINLLLLGFFTLATLNNVNGSSNSIIGCIESEKAALLQFKQHLIDPANRLASWVVHEDCCRRWVGVVCHNESGHVLELHLQNPSLNDDVSFDESEANRRYRLGGKIHHSLLNLTHLSYLDLSNNDFGRIPIPDFFGSMARLRHLNLSSAGFGGLIPHQLGNLSNMEYLNLEVYGLHVDNLQWLAGMSQLKYLHLSAVDLSKALDWLQSLNMVPSLKELHLSYCQIPSESTLLSPNNLSSSLAILNLGVNFIQNTSAPIMSWVFSLKTLVSLDLSSNGFEGPIPDALQNLTSLRHLDLSDNQFNSSIPDWFYGFSPLEFLNLRYNNLRGQISSAIGNMTCAISVDLSGNKQLEGGIPKSLGNNLCNLKSISLGGVKLSQNVSDILQMLSFGCMSHGLESLDLSSSHLFGQLTDHLGNFKNLREVDLSQNSIVGYLPESLGELPMLRVLDVSYNNLKGNNLPELFETHSANFTKLTSLRGIGNPFIFKVHPNWIPPFQLVELEIGSWQLGPQFPHWLRSQKQLTHLNISNSGISDTIPCWFWNMSSQFVMLDISHNQIYGEIPYIPLVQPLVSFDFSSNFFNGSLPRISPNLMVLDLSNNSFSGSLFSFLCHKMNETMSLVSLFLSENYLFGELTDCWAQWPNLVLIKLDGNNLVGSLPTSLGMLTSLGSLHLRHNRISGELPNSLQNCTHLMLLDLSQNELTGQIPTWLGPSFKKLEILNVRSNKFHGQIPNKLCTLASLRILDLSRNNLSGFLPKCIGNFSAMAAPDDGNTNYELKINYRSYFYLDDGSFVMKGNLLNYSSTLRLVRIINLSYNNLWGEIPQGVARLQRLQSLNLSRNHFSGRIPEGIGAMKSLEALDFSQNNLSGSIPQSVSDLTFLSYLDLSNNDLIGKIPSSTQILGFPASTFTGNRLCGPPLTQNCSAANGQINPSLRNEDEGSDEVDWFYVAMAIGFGTGFGAFLVPLMVSRRWSCIYFQFLDRMWTRILLLLCAKATRFRAV